ncbi:type IV toxin-antitoxin system AbiEi family antitoxin [Nocardia sp. NPDC058705]|uniref:type IV toxin-antitoxin system AbiEi family antitoxin n=1 Tax=Nocardia sp. NPDC058705 TaxID=3346609 RepID=UPI0036B009A0
MRVASGEPDLLLVAPDDTPRPTALKIQTRDRLMPSTLRRLQERDRNIPSSVALLYAANAAAAPVVAAAEAGEFDLVLADPPMVIINGSVLLNESPPRHSGQRHRVAWQRLAVERVLAISERPMTQRDIAAATGVTQQAVSAAMRSNSNITHTPNEGWSGTSELLEVWLREYPGPRGTQTHWFGLDAPTEQYRVARDLLSELAVGSVLTGDLAADRYAPWMLPSSVRLYVDDIVDFTAAGFSPADSADATMTIVMPDDRSIRTVAAHLRGEAPVDGHLVADPAIILWDLLHNSSDPTSTEAAHVVRTAIDKHRAG